MEGKDKNAEASEHNKKNNDETMRNDENPLKNSVESTPKKVKESSMEEKPIVPYPQILRRRQLDHKFDKFMENFKKFRINIPFAQALEQMSRYVKFMKDILVKKKKLGDYERVSLSKECSVILQKKLLPKLKDPGSFTISCASGN